MLPVSRRLTRTIPLALALSSLHACAQFRPPQDPLDSNSVRVSWRDGDRGHKVVGTLIAWDSVRVAVKRRDGADTVRIARADVSDVRRYRGLDRETPAMIGAAVGVLVGVAAVISDSRHRRNCTPSGLLGCDMYRTSPVVMIAFPAVGLAVAGAAQGKESWESVKWMSP